MQIPRKANTILCVILVEIREKQANRNMWIFVFYKPTTSSKNCSKRFLKPF